MSVVGWNCVSCYPLSRPIVCCWKRMRRICCPGICSPNRHHDVMNRPTGHIAERVAHWRGEDVQWLAAQTDDNVRRLFGVQF